LDYVLHNDSRTALANGDAVVEMTEHVLSAFMGMGIDDALIELDAPETPAADGSAQLFVQLLRNAGTRSFDATIEPILIDETLRIDDGVASIRFEPSDEPTLEIRYELDYAHPGIGRQQHTVLLDGEVFGRDIAPARTFVLAREVAALQAIGIGRRHSARDLLVFGDDGSLIDNVRRFDNECARHKILDIVGDLALLGRPVFGRIIAQATGHRHNVALARMMRNSSRSS
jgi:UDP-3-O-acyl N-acetylglucosamine deacetylase